MKISKNELRKMIFETVLQKEKALNEVSLRKMRKTIIDAQEEDKKQEDGDVPIGDNEDVSKIIDELEAFKKKSTGPFNPKNKSRAQEAEDLLQFAKEAKAGKKPDAPPPAATDTAGTESTGDWKQYNNETEWLYKIKGDTPNEIWVTKKAEGNGPEYELNKPKYAATVKKLDSFNTLPKRTQESINNDPALKTPAAKPAADKKTAPDTRLTTPSELGSSNPANDRDDVKSPGDVPEKVTSSLPTIKTSQEVKDKVTLRMAAYEIDFLPQQLKPDYEKGNITNALIDHIKFKTPEAERNKDNIELAKMILLRDTDLNRSQLSAFKDQNNYAGILKAMSNMKVGFDLEGNDSNYPSGFKNKLLGALARAFGMNPDSYKNIPLNESKVIYGKSHATLIRERYWGRY